MVEHYRHEINMNYFELIPELKKWDNDPNKAFHKWLCCIGNLEHAIGYSQLFWPNFIEYQNCVFLEQNFTKDAFNEWNTTLKNNLTNVESTLNHIHLSEAFGNPDMSSNERQLYFLGNLLFEMWKCKLRLNFPKKTFIIDFTKGSKDNLLNFQITFHTKRST